MSRAAEKVVQRHRLSVADYHRMGEAGPFAEGVRVELIGGEIIDMSPIGSAHVGMVARLGQMLYAAAGQNAIVYIQNPILLDDNSEPEPDLALLKTRDDFYATSHPEPEDVLLLVEVFDTTLRYDREVKVPLYASAGIPEVWLIDIGGNQLEVFRKPAQQGLLRPQTGERIHSVMSPDVIVSMDALWPKG